MSTYEIDLVGDNADNLIVPASGTEEKTLIADASLSNRVFQPNFAPFFADTLVVERQLTVNDPWVPLTENADYRMAYKFISASIASGQNVYAAIIINSGNVAGKIRFTQYHTIGGPWADDKSAAIATIANTPYDPRVVTWDQVHGVPDELPLTSHSLAATDLTVHNDLVLAINNLAATIGAGNHEGVLEYLLCNSNCGVNCDPVDRNYINAILNRIREINTDLQEKLNSIDLGLAMEHRINDTAGTVGIGIGVSDGVETGAIGIGLGSAISLPRENSVSIGVSAGANNAGVDSVNIGTNAGETATITSRVSDYSYSLNEVALPADSDPVDVFQGLNVVNIGYNAGLVDAEQYAVNIGSDSGLHFSGFGSTNVGHRAGQRASVNSVNIGGWTGGGYSADNPGIAPRFLDRGGYWVTLEEGQDSVNIGWRAGSNDPGQRTVNIGWHAGDHSGLRAVNIGDSAGKAGSDKESTNVGAWAGYLGSGLRDTNIGYKTGGSGGLGGNTNIGDQAGAESVDCSYQTGIGGLALRYANGDTNTALGYSAGRYEFYGDKNVFIGAHGPSFPNGTSVADMTFDQLFLIGVGGGHRIMNNNDLFVWQANATTFMKDYADGRLVYYDQADDNTLKLYNK